MAAAKRGRACLRAIACSRSSKRLPATHEGFPTRRGLHLAMERRMICTPRNSRLGLTLIELMVGTAIGAVVIAAAFTFMVHQNYRSEFTNREIDRDRSGRVALEMLG